MSAEDSEPFRSGSSRAALLLLLIWSVLYLAEGWLRCTAKYFWFDELCTLYIARLPSFAQSWAAVLHGADYNPPLFYVIMRAVEHTLGEGLFAFRLPALLGVWTFCVSLFYVVWRRLGLASGCIALLFPLTTTAAYYAYEARPHGLVLGFVGLAIVSWYSLRDRPQSWPRTAAFSLCLAAAFFTHCYAAICLLPFAVSEFFAARRTGVIRPRIWAALALPSIAAVVSFIPLLHAYRANLAGTGFAYQFRSGFWQLPFFYGRLLAPGSVVIVALFLVSADRNVRDRLDTALAASFALLPIAAVMLALVIHGPFIGRYFLATVAGLALLLASLATRRMVRILLLAAILLTLGRNFGTTLWHRWHGAGETLSEPVVGITINTTPGQPLARYRPLASTDRTLPILVAEPMDFLYLIHYAPELAPRLFYAASSRDEANYHLYRNILTWCHLRFNESTTEPDFLAAHPRFYVWGDALHLQALGRLQQSDRRIESFQSDGDIYLALLIHTPAEVTVPQR